MDERKPMRICYVMHDVYTLGGVQNVTIIKANALAALPGNHVALIVADNSLAPALTLAPAVRLIALGLSTAELQTAGGAFADLFVERLQHVISRLQPDVVIVNAVYELLALRHISFPPQTLKVREVHVNARYEQYSLGKPWRRWLAWLTFHPLDRQLLHGFYDRYVVLTASDRHRTWHDDARVSVIPNPLVLSSPPHRATLETKVAIAAGRICPQKDYPALVRVWARVVREHPDWQLHLYGEAPKTKALSELTRVIRRLHLEEHVRLMGRCHDLTARMAEASVHVMTSRWEGFGLVITEAMACGVPTVAYDCPFGPSDIIADGQDGFVVPQGDERALAARLCQLISDSDLRHSMGEAALAAARRYQPAAIAQQWMSLFREMREEKNPAN